MTRTMNEAKRTEYTGIIYTLIYNDYANDYEFNFDNYNDAIDAADDVCENINTELQDLYILECDFGNKQIDVVKDYLA